MRENLLGYLLGALEDDEHQQVEEALQTDPRLRDELTRIEAHLTFLETDEEHHEPPPGLARRTCISLSGRACDPGARELDRPERPVGELSGTTAGGESQPKVVRRLAPTREFVSWREWSFADYAMATGIVLAASFLFFPAIAHSRYRAQSLACENNLRQLGVALTSYSDMFGGWFPQPAKNGPRAIAGIAGPSLAEVGLLDSPQLLLCPGVSRNDRPAGWRLPRTDEIETARGEDLVRLQRFAGGDLAFPLGFIQNGQYHGPRNLHRTHHAIVADAPCHELDGHQSRNHLGRGQNVLFEDGHLRYFPRCSGEGCLDALFLNRAGRIEAGVDENDIVLGRSETPPFVEIER